MNCDKCAACCRDLLWVTEKEIYDLRWYIKEHHIKDQNGMIDLCPFLTMGGKCAVYTKRPLICRVFECHHEWWEDEAAKKMFGSSYKPRSIRAAVFEMPVPFR